LNIGALRGAKATEKSLHAGEVIYAITME